jgi:branched-chain amino acid transport system ATP-binding protein
MGSHVKRLADDGHSVILVEQNASLPLSLAKKIYVLEIGKIALEGDAKKLKVNEHIKEFYLGL